MIVAGIGCRRGCPADDIFSIVRAAERRADCRADALAAPAFKRDETGLLAAARSLGMDISFIAAAELDAVQDRCPTKSAAASRHVGAASVAEAAAIAACGGELILPRIANRRATCALAAS